MEIDKLPYEVTCAICNRVIESDDMTQRTLVRVYDIETLEPVEYHRECWDRRAYARLRRDYELMDRQYGYVREVSK